MEKEKIKWILRLVFIQSILAIVISSSFLWLQKSNKLSAGTHIEDLNVGEMTKEEALIELEKYYDRKLKNKKIKIKYGTNLYTISLNQLEIKPKYRDLIEELFKESNINKFRELVLSYTPNKRYVFYPEYIINQGKLVEFFKELSKKTEKPPKEPTLILPKNSDGDVRIVPAKNGIKIDVQKAVQLFISNIRKYLNEEIIDDFDNNNSIFIKTSPKVNNYVIEGIEKTVAKAKIVFDKKLFIQETECIKEIIDNKKNVIIKPKEEFSLKEKFLDVERLSTDEDYRKGASVLSTALYNAVIKMDNIDITYRETSRRPLSWAPLGGEAVIAADGDLKFINNSNSKLWVVFALYTSKNFRSSLVVFILGDKKIESYPVNYRIEEKLPNPVVYKESAYLMKNERRILVKGEPGYVIGVYREKPKNNILIYKERYEPTTTVIEVGIGAIQKEFIK